MSKTTETREQTVARLQAERAALVSRMNSVGPYWCGMAHLARSGMWPQLAEIDSALKALGYPEGRPEA